MRTLKLCRQKEPDIISHMSSVKGRETLIVCGRTQRLRAAERTKVVGDLLHISSKQGVKILALSYYVMLA